MINDYRKTGETVVLLIIPAQSLQDRKCLDDKRERMRKLKKRRIFFDTYLIHAVESCIL